MLLLWIDHLEVYNAVVEDVYPQDAGDGDDEDGEAGQQDQAVSRRSPRR